MTRIHGSKKRKNDSADPWVSFLVKVLFVVTIILMLPKLVTGAKSTRPRRHYQKKKRFRHIRALREYCLDECADDDDMNTITLLEESANCINRCVSQPCYEKEYGNAPLEDGEIDLSRYQNFENCVLLELKEEARRENQKQREARRTESSQ
mmetsp:Transcript_2165/g.3217  ORF Transcript_2165/g.3217 Transcript_2165/m.3217 type:complete len:151 (+) Transcript_2165:133-585(+)